MINFIKNNAFARNSLILFSGSIVGSLLNYLFHLIIGRLVSVEIYGQTESLISLIAVISVPAATLGLVATKFAAAGKAENDPADSRRLLKYFNRQVFIYGLPIFLLALILTPLIEKFLKINDFFPLVMIWSMMFLSFFGAINGGILSGWQKFGSVSVNGIIGTLAKLFFGLVLVRLGFALSGIIGAFAIAAVISYFISLLMLKFLKPAFGEKEKTMEKKINFQSIKNYVLPVFIGSLAINLLGNIDMIFAKHNLNPILAGQYGALNVVSKVIFFITGVIASVLFAMAAEHDHKKIDSTPILKNALGLTMLICAGSIVFYFLFPRFVLSVFFGAKYLSAAAYLGWFAVSASLFSLANLILQYLLSIHETKIVNFFLVVSILAGVFILLLGKTVSAVLIIISLANLVGVLFGIIFLYRKKISQLDPTAVPIINYIE